MILITGAKGIIGKQLCELLTREDYEFIPHPFDICIPPTLKECNGVIHLAAVSRVQPCENNAVECIRTNVLGTVTLLEYAKQHKCWFIYVSTMNTGSLYSASKEMGELLCKYYAKQKWVKCAILKVGNVYGVSKGNNLVTSVINGINEQREVTVENPDKVLYPAHIDKVIEKIMKYVKKKVGRDLITTAIYNETITWGELVHKLKEEGCGKYL